MAVPTESTTKHGQKSRVFPSTMRILKPGFVRVDEGGGPFQKYLYPGHGDGDTFDALNAVDASQLLSGGFAEFVDVRQPSGDTAERADGELLEFGVVNKLETGGTYSPPDHEESQLLELMVPAGGSVTVTGVGTNPHTNAGSGWKYFAYLSRAGNWEAID